MTLAGALDRLRSYLTARVGLACIGAVTLGFILVCFAILLDARRDATEQAATKTRNIASSLVEEVARNLDIYDLSLQAVVQGLQYPGLNNLAPELRQMLLFQRAAKASYFSFINVVDEHGTVTADSESLTLRGGNFAGRDYFTAQRNDARDMQFIGAPFSNQPGKQPTIPISRRMSHPDGTFAGVVVGSLRLAYFRDLFSRLTLAPHATIELLRDDGMILMRLPFAADDIGRTLPANAPFFAARSGGQVDAEDPADHQRRHFLFQRIGTWPLVVGVGLADADIYAAWYGKAAALGGVVAALAAIDLLLLLIVRYALVRREAGLAALRIGDAERATLAAQRESAVAVAARTAAAKTRFLATMSHELRTPLNSILGYAELLAQDGNLQPVQAARIAAMRSAGNHIREVVNRVLDFSRVEADDTAAPEVRTDLAALIAQCRTFAEPMAAAQGLRLICNIAPDVPPYVMADAGSIRQVLLNLLANAVKFTERGEVRLLVTQGKPVAQGKTATRFVVADTGIGVTPDQRNRLFQPYERLDADRIGVPGTGLGLAIAARTVTRMGGRLGHEDNPVGGSIFWVELPLRAAPGPPSAARAEAAPPTRPLRILVADDSALNRDVAASFLQTAGHTVMQAPDGEAALRLVVAEAFDAVLMDLRMPVLDGIEATRHIRALPGRLGQTPVIAVTAEVQEDDGAELWAAGFQACLLKPIDQVSLLAAVALAAANRPSVMGAQPSAACGHSAAMTPWAAPTMPGLLTPTPYTSFPDPPMPSMTAPPLPVAAPHPVAPPLPDMTARLPEGLAAATVDGHLEMFATLLVSLLELLDITTKAWSPDCVTAGSPAPSVTGMTGSPSDAAPDCPDRSLPVQSAAPNPRPAQVELAHRIAGDGGQLGFLALSDAARRYETAWHRDAALLPQATAALRESAENALQALSQRRDFMRRAAMSSAKLT